MKLIRFEASTNHGDEEGVWLNPACVECVGGKHLTYVRMTSGQLWRISDSPRVVMGMLQGEARADLEAEVTIGEDGNKVYSQGEQ